MKVIGRLPKLGRAELFAIVLILAAFNSLSTRLASSIHNESLINSALGLFGVNAILWFALYALLRCGLDAAHSDGVHFDRLNKWDVVAAALIALASFLPTHIPALLALLLGGIYLFASSAKSSASRRVAIVALAMTGPLLWGSVALRILGPELLAFDAILGGGLAGYDVTGNVILTPVGELDLLIGAGCSAFRNITYVFLLVACLTQLLNIPFSWRIALSMVVAIAMVIAINGVRLAMLARFPQHFEYLHVGGGMVLFGYATLLSMVVVIGSAIMWRPKRILAH